ncbi:MAG: hypothetical protein LGR52_09940 [Candidatus Thiosymbion ectosymbiont of Robbea hypermnestra]|nr:hypothetical protein [Candidatus Thiosymbion ectosymbiont of Robbea hypermnestra]
MERCPNCHARGEDAASCRRCGMDLTKLTAVEQAAERLTALGIAHLATGDPATASNRLTRALGLHRTPLTERLLGFAEQLRKDHLSVPDTVEQPGNGVRS